MASDMVDVGRIAAHLGIDPAIISAALDTPTTAHVRDVLAAVGKKARETDLVQAEKLQLETRLDTTVRTSAKQYKAARADADQAREELASARYKLQEQELVRTGAEKSLQVAASLAQAHDRELESLRSEVEALQASVNASTSHVVQRNTRIDELAKDLTKSMQHNTDLGREIHVLTAKAREAESDATTAKYHEKSLMQQIELANRHADWSKSELNKKAEELQQFRTEKLARIAELTRLNEEARHEIQSLQRQVAQQRQRLQDSDVRLEAAHVQYQKQLANYNNAQATWANEKRELTRAAARAAEKSQALAEEAEAQHKEVLATLEDRIKELEVVAEASPGDSFAFNESNFTAGAATADRMTTINPATQKPGRYADYEISPDGKVTMYHCLQPAGSGGFRVITPGKTSIYPNNNSSWPSRTIGPRMETPAVPKQTPAVPAPTGGAAQITEEARLARGRNVKEAFHKLKASLAEEQKHKAHFQSAYEEAVAKLESTGPEIFDLRNQQARSNAELSKMSERLEESNTARDAAAAALRKAEAQLRTSTSEIAILKTQIRDSGMQIRMLIFNLAAQEKGMDYLTREEQQQYERLAAGQAGNEDETVAGVAPAPTDVSDTDQFISQRFIVYRNINQLQVQNMEITRTLRELSSKLEHEERLVKGATAAKDEETIKKLQRDITNLNDQIASARVTMASYRAERNMFRGLMGRKALSIDNQELQPQPSQGQRSSTGADAEHPITVGDDDAAITCLGHGAAPTAPAGVVDTDNDPPARDPRALQHRLVTSGSRAKPGSAATALRSQQVLFDDFRSDHAEIKRTLQDTIAELREDKSRLQADMAALASREALATQRYATLQSNYTAIQGEIAQIRESHCTASATVVGLQSRIESLTDELVSSNCRLESLRREAANMAAEKELWRNIQERLAHDNDALIKDNTRLTQVLADSMNIQNEREISQAEARRVAEARTVRLETELGEVRSSLAEEQSNHQDLKANERDLNLMHSRTIEALRNKTREATELTAERDRLESQITILEAKLQTATAHADDLESQHAARVVQEAASDNASVLREMGDELDTLRRQLDSTQSELEDTQREVEQHRAISKDLENALLSATTAREVLEAESQAIIDREIEEGKRLSARMEKLTGELNVALQKISDLERAEADLVKRQEAALVTHQTEMAQEHKEVERLVEAARYHQEDMQIQAQVAAKAQKDYETELAAHTATEKQLLALNSSHNQAKTELAVAKALAASAKIAFDHAEASWQDRMGELNREVSDLKARDDAGKRQIEILLDQLDGLTRQALSARQLRTSTVQPLGQSSASGTGTGPDMLAMYEGLRELNNYLRREKESNEAHLNVKTAEAMRLRGQVDVLSMELDEIRLVLEQERKAATAAASASDATNLPHAELMEKLGELNDHRERSARLRAELEENQTGMAARAAEADSLLVQIQSLQTEVEGLRAGSTHLEDELAAVRHDRDEWQRRTEAIIAKYPGKAAANPAESEKLKKEVADLQETLEEERAGWASSREKLVAQFKERSKRLTGERNDALIHAKASEDNLAAARAEVDEHKGQVARLEARVQQVMSQMPMSPEVNITFVVQLQQRIGNLERQLETVTAAKALIEARLEKAIPKAPAQSAAAAERQQQQLRDQLVAAQSTVTELRSRLVVLETAAKDLEQSRVDAEAKANELEANQTKIIKDRSDKMKAAFNDRLKESRTKLEDDFAIKLEQEKAAWEADQQQRRQESTSAALDEATTPPQMARQPSPIISEAGIITSHPTPSADTPTTQDEMLAALPDAEVRRFLSTNVTVKSIVANNIKKRVDVEAARLRAEYEPKIQSARESAEELSRKRGLLRINMAEKRLGLANSRLAVVEKAAGETPLRPVAQVWAEVKEVTEEPPKEAAVPAPATVPAPAAGQTPPRSPVVPTGPAAAQYKNGHGHHGRGRGGKPRGGGGGGGQGVKRPRGHSEAAGGNAAAEDSNKRPREG